MSKLYRVEVTRTAKETVVVYADTKSEALQIAYDNAAEIADESVDGYETDADVMDEIKGADGLPLGWGKYSTPYGAKRTVGELLGIIADPTPARCPHTVDMFA